MSADLTEDQRQAMWAMIDATETANDLDVVLVKYYALGWLWIPTQLSARRKRLLAEARKQ
jgi:hypothetical protein